MLPAAGNFAGGLLAEWRRPSPRGLNLALHAASGILFAVIAVEIMPRALASSASWVLALAFLGGGAAYLVIEALLERWQKNKNDSTGALAWKVYMAVAADLVGDGLLIGAGSAVSGRLGLALALGQVLADLPEGFAVTANFRDKGMRRLQRLAVSASFVVPVLAAAGLSYVLLRDQGPTMKNVGLVAVAGLYSLAAVEDMLGEAHESAKDSRWSALCFLAGFSLFFARFRFPGVTKYPAPPEAEPA